ncbi:MAG: phosphohydrolase [Alphaproteobacteria bacterium]|nr:phosphohydrolase [Alphaproteobacteria bacterium]
MNTAIRRQARFTRLDQATSEDFAILHVYMSAERQKLSDRVLQQLHDLRGPKLGMQVDRFEHSLQTATRAKLDGADEETIVCALLHDIGDHLAPDNHGAFVSEILRPFVSDTNYQILRYHPEFQGYFFFDKLGADPNMRERHRGKPWFDLAHRFCERWDMPAFDPAYQALPIETFEPMVRRLFAKPATHNGVVLPSADTGKG